MQLGIQPIHELQPPMTRDAEISKINSIYSLVLTLSRKGERARFFKYVKNQEPKALIAMVLLKLYREFEN